MKTVTLNQLKNTFIELGLKNKSVEVHSSLKSFGKLEHGAQGFLDTTLDVFDNSIYPAFYEKAHILPTDYKKYKRNGLYLDLINRDDWIGATFDKNSPIDKDMGAIAQKVLQQENFYRSAHPTRSWIGLGKSINEILENQTLDLIHEPIKRLAEKDGYVLLVGVGLTRCTAIHYAEELAGRKYFIRWVKKDNKIMDTFEAGDSSGFDNFASVLESIKRQTILGNSTLTVYPLKDLLKIVSEKIVKNPDVTRCSDNCPVCDDAIRGGPYIA